MRAWPPRAPSPDPHGSGVRTRVVAVDPLVPDAGAIAEAAAVLAAGGVVAFPTDTFYGLGVSALDAAAVGRLFAVKERPESRPILVLVDDVARIEPFAILTARARELAARHWPGALTLVLPARALVPTSLTAGTGTIGVRQPAHAVARALVAALASPITAPSANRSGDAPPARAEDVLAVFDGRIDLVLDAGPTPGGLPSTVLDVTVEPPRVLRAGAVRVTP
jgi:L-threonylcarbamoyladenylate synthase